ncbi:MAG: hypothetical protein OEW59_08715 [Gammaproteobacteria bacterium]|nr:hypothetical protein [Gammaproteobacteria bacterium]
MKKLFSIENSLEALAILITVAALLGVLQTFLIGRHFVIPTMILLLALLFGNLARFGLRGERWAKHMLFWLFLLMACHAFFALFWAADARPGALFGAAFYPVYGGFLVVTGGLCAAYARRNRLLA